MDRVLIHIEFTNMATVSHHFRCTQDYFMPLLEKIVVVDILWIYITISITHSYNSYAHLVLSVALHL